MRMTKVYFIHSIYHVHHTVQRLAKAGAPGLVNFITAVAHHFTSAPACTPHSHNLGHQLKPIFEVVLLGCQRRKQINRKLISTLKYLVLARLPNILKLVPVRSSLLSCKHLRPCSKCKILKPVYGYIVAACS